MADPKRLAAWIRTGKRPNKLAASKLHITQQKANSKRQIPVVNHRFLQFFAQRLVQHLFRLRSNFSLQNEANQTQNVAHVISTVAVAQIDVPWTSFLIQNSSLMPFEICLGLQYQQSLRRGTRLSQKRVCGLQGQNPEALSPKESLWREIQGISKHFVMTFETRSIVSGTKQEVEKQCHEDSISVTEFLQDAPRNRQEAARGRQSSWKLTEAVS